LATREIPRSEWVRFCNDYSRQHEGWLATVQVRGGNVGEHVEARSLPLRGISFEEKGTEKGDLAIFLSQSPGTDETHNISRPTHLRIDQDGGMDRGLEVEAQDGTTTSIRFVNPSRPEAVARL
jgi:hypothetical protein